MHKNILFIIETLDIGTKLALIPAHILQGTPIESIHNKILNCDEMSEKEQDLIVEMYCALGLETSDNPYLRVYLNPKPPFTVDWIIRFGWAV